LSATFADPRSGGRRVGTRRLTWFALHRDRARIPVWIMSVGAMVAYYLAVAPAVYPDATARQGRAASLTSAAAAMLSGPGYGLHDYTLGAMVANELLGMLAVAAALMSVFLVVRHTRADEETGRTELVRSAVVGGFAPLTAALLDAVIANLAVAAAVLAALVGNHYAVPDSLAVAAGVALVGLVFADVAAVTAQLTDRARSASGAAGGAVGLAYVLRAVGDAQRTGGSALSWLSPIGWAQQTRAFVEVRWWPLALCAALAAVLVVLAYSLTARRDLGAGLVPQRGGRAGARRTLLNPVGFTFALERGGLIAWAIGLAVFAALTGSMGPSIVAEVVKRPNLLGGSATGNVLRATLGAALSTYAMTVACYAVNTIDRIRREEAEGRTGVVLTAVGRPAWLASSLLVAAGNCALLLLVCGLALGACAGVSVGEPGLTWDLAVASLTYLPVVLCFAGLAALAYGLGRGIWWVWTLLMTAILVGLYGPLLSLPQAVLDLAPFSLATRALGVAHDPSALLAMAGVAILAGVTGIVTFRRRDLAA